MRLLIYAVPFLLGYALCWLIVRRGLATEPPARELVRRDALESLVADLRETAWDHRDVDPALSTIVIDKIRTFERENRDHP